MDDRKGSPLETNRRSHGGTRERVIDVALRLFNDRGPDRVTTSQIAAGAQINEGNLYYYFKTKQALILAIFERFDIQVGEMLAEQPQAAGPSAYLALLRQWFAFVWDYRFLFRDLLGLLATAPEMRQRISALSVRLREPVEAIVQNMQAAGLLKIPEEERARLLANVWIVATYWVVYLQVQEDVQQFDEAQLHWGLRQVLSLFTPYLSDAARLWLDDAPLA